MGQTFNQMGWQDREVKVHRDDLLDVLRKNRDQHVKDFKEACAGYRDEALKKIDEAFKEARQHIESLKAGKLVNVNVLYVNLQAPVSHEKAYDQIIRMMEMSVDKEIVLTASQFGCFVMDDWDWKQNWLALNAGYTKKL